MADRSSPLFTRSAQLALAVVTVVGATRCHDGRAAISLLDEAHGAEPARAMGMTQSSPESGVVASASETTGDAAARDEAARDEVASGGAEGDSAPRANAAEHTSLPPLTDAVWLETMPLSGGREAVVSVPLGATAPRPVMIGMHGLGDRPEWACGGYRAATDAFPFIVCPRGARLGAAGETFVTPRPPQLADEIDAAVAAVHARFGRYVADGPLLYAGFSLGAINGAKVIAERPSLFPVALLIEGAYYDITPALASKYAHGGGRRVLLGCAQVPCASWFAYAERALRGAGIEVRIVDSHTGVHNLDGPMMAALHDAWPWLVSDDPRWNVRPP